MCNFKGVNIFLNSFLENNLPPLFLGLVVMTVIFCISSAFFNLLERACCHIFLKCKDKYISFVLFLVVTRSNVFFHFVLGHKMFLFVTAASLVSHLCQIRTIPLN